jgi:hypothetical protein
MVCFVHAIEGFDWDIFLEVEFVILGLPRRFGGHTNGGSTAALLKYPDIRYFKLKGHLL